MLVSALFFAMGSPATSAVLFRATAEVRDAQVLLGDVADLSALPATVSAPARHIIVARLPDGVGTISVANTRIAARARAAMPLLAKWFPATSGAVAIRRLPDPSPRQSESGSPACARVIHAMSAGAVLAAGNTEVAPCRPARISAAFRYDASDGSVRARRAIGPDDLFSWVPPSMLSDVRPGDRLTLSVSVGPVRVDRVVQALQPGHAGAALFVQSQDGAVFAAPAPVAQ